MRLKSFFKELLGIAALERRVTYHKERSDARINTLSRAIDEKVKELDALTKMDCDIGMRGHSTIILTGVYRGKGYVQFYDIPPDQFEYLVKDFQSRRKSHLIRNIDAPQEYFGRGGAFTL